MSGIASAPSFADAPLRVSTEPLGPIGTGSKFFRTATCHSSGVIFIGTYGPQPAIIWKFDPKVGRLEKVAEPGQYQLDSMVEGPDGAIYIGTAYEGLVYRMDPVTGAVTSLGSPPVDSTTWIFTIVTTRSGEMYGAKGVGLFRLDWKKGAFESMGLVPGNHTTLGPTPSMPITRILEEDADGVLWGDTNRWLFRFTPGANKIEPVADMSEIDPATYCLFLPSNPVPKGQDVWFCLYARYGSGDLKHVFYRYSRERERVEPVDVVGVHGNPVGHLRWWQSPDGPRLLVPEWHEERASMAVIDPATARVVERWESEGTSPVSSVPGTDRYFVSWSELLELDRGQKVFRVLATNPTPAEARCLAAKAPHVLGTDTYDFGHMFALNLDSMVRTDHGKVWADDHRCNYGPAVFAGENGRYFIANHSQLMQSLWVTDTQTNRHWRIGESASQLRVMADGAVWGVFGPNPNTLTFDEQSWRPRFETIAGPVFRYQPGAETVEVMDAFGDAGPLVEAPGALGQVLAVKNKELWLWDPKGETLERVAGLEHPVLVATADPTRLVSYLLDEQGRLLKVIPESGGLELKSVAESFGPADRGLFVLPRTRRVLAVAEDGRVSVYDPDSNSASVAIGPVPEPAGPAVDPAEDSWYYAGEQVTRYRLEPISDQPANTF